MNGLSDENLVVEVWDFDPAETIGEKMSKVLDIKGVRGFRKLMKEIAVTASTGKHDNELIGKCSISLRVRIKPTSLLFIEKNQTIANKLKFLLHFLYTNLDNSNCWFGHVVQFG